MSDLSVQVKFGADHSQLTSSLALAQAEARKWGAEMRALADQITATGAAADSQLTAKLGTASSAFATAQAEVKKLTKETHEGGNALQWFSSHMSETVREVHAMGDELASGRTKQFIGSFAKLFGDFAAANPVIGALTLGVIALGGAFVYLESLIIGAKEAADQLAASMAGVGNVVDKTAITTATNEFARFTNESYENSQKIISVFATMQGASVDFGEKMAVTSKALADALGIKLEEAVKHLAEAYQEPSTKGMALLNTMHLLTPSVLQQMAAAKETGERMREWGVIVAALTGDFQRQGDQYASTKDAQSALASTTEILGMKFFGLSEAFNVSGRAAASMASEFRLVAAFLPTLATASGAAETGMTRMTHAMQAADKAVPAFDKLAKLRGEIKELDETIQGKVGASGIEGKTAVHAPASDLLEIAKMTKQMQIMQDEAKKLGQSIDVSLGGSTAFEDLKNNLNEIRASGVVNAEALRKAEMDGLQKIAADTTLTTAERKRAREELAQQHGVQVEKETAVELKNLELRADVDRRGSAQQITDLQKAASFALAKYGEQSEQYIGLQRRMAVAHRAANQQELEAQVRAAQGQIKLLDEEQAHLKAQLDQKVAMGKMTAAEEQKQLQANLEKQYLLQVEELNKEKALLRDKPAEYQNVLERIQQLQMTHSTKIIEMQTKEFETYAQKWKSAADDVSGAFNSQLRGMLSGQTTYTQAAKNIIADLTLKWIESFIKTKFEFLANKAAELTFHTSVEAGKTAATEAGAAARLTAELSSILAAAAKAIESAFAWISSGAAATVAGVSAFMAPLIGPAAPAVGASAGATVEATSLAMLVPSADIGGRILSDGLLYGHAGETIVPAAMAQPYAGGAGDTHVHLTYQHMGGSTTLDDLRANSGALARMVADAFRANPAIRRERW